jgi:hypothetical protein
VQGKITSQTYSGGIVAKKPTAEDAKLILKLYDLKREPELRKARQWWLVTFWPDTADDFLKVAMTLGSQENNWFRQVISYWGIAGSFVLNGLLSEKLFFEQAFCGELFIIYAKVKPFLKELREKTKNPKLMLNVEKVIRGSKLGREQFAMFEPRIATLRPKP